MNCTELTFTASATERDVEEEEEEEKTEGRRDKFHPRREKNSVMYKKKGKTSTSILCLHCLSWCSICQVLLKMSHKDFMVHLKDD